MRTFNCHIYAEFYEKITEVMMRFKLTADTISQEV